MGVQAVVEATGLRVDPGGTATCTIRVTNTGQVVDQFTMSVIGEAEAWTTVEPASLNLFPGAEGQAVVRFAPPRSSSVKPGELPFGVRVVATEQADTSIIEEGAITVGAFSDLYAELLPRATRGSRRGHHTLAIDNRGNESIRAELRGVDARSMLGFAISPPSVDLNPGSAVFSKVVVTPPVAFNKGPDRPFPFQVQAVRPEAQPLTADGTFVQSPRFPSWTAAALEALLAAIVVLAILWFALLRPTIKSDAKSAATQAVATQSGGGAGGSKGSGSGGGGSGGGAGGGSTSTTTGSVTQLTAPTTISVPTTTGPTSSTVVAASATPPGAPVDGRLSVTSPGTVAYQVPAGQSLDLTDIFFENPGGDTGPMSLERNGSPLLVLELANFRDLDEHFDTPIVFPGGSQLQLDVACTSPACTPGAYFTGRLVPGG